MEKKTLSSILEGKIFIIPDYQRGYAWEEEHWKDFVEDIDALIDDQIKSHYTGTIVIYQQDSLPTDSYGTKKLEIVEVVDGQQRLTTCSLYLSIIMKELVKLGFEDFKAEEATYLHSGTKNKLILNNDTADFYHDLISKGVNNVEPNSVHQKRIYEAYCFLKDHIEKQLRSRNEKGEEYLRDLFDAIIRKLNFTFYRIRVESEIGMTFELMNSRGKGLSPMELLKNYLMYWVYRNIPDKSEKEDFTNIINKTWRDVYVNIAKCDGSESQCLRIAWTLLVNYTPRSWDGYNGFKSDDVIPLRNFSKKSKEEVKDFILIFVDQLALISKHYSLITKPTSSSLVDNELILLTNIINAGNIANYLPLMIASRIRVERKEINSDDYIDLLTSLEKYSYRVFLWEGKRSNAGLSRFYRLADDVFYLKHSLLSVTQWIYEMIEWYSPENHFRKKLTEDFFGWYHSRRLLKYTLFEYELFLLRGRDKPKLNWEDLSDSTIEHILPQNPAVNSNWLSKWSGEDRSIFIDDISNLVLTKDNSRYSNFEFERKSRGVDSSGKKVSEYYYANSDIRQERKISQDFEDWTPESCMKRREELTSWIIENWGITNHHQQPIMDIVEEEEEVVFVDID